MQYFSQFTWDFDCSPIQVILKSKMRHIPAVSTKIAGSNLSYQLRKCDKLLKRVIFGGPTIYHSFTSKVLCGTRFLNLVKLGYIFVCNYTFPVDAN